MMKNWKKLAAACLAASTVLTMAACGSSDNNTSSEAEKESSAVKQESSEAATGEVVEDLYYSTTGHFPICEEPITITVAGQYNGTPNWNETEFVQVVEEQMGIKMECTQYEQDAWSTQLTLLMSSDDLPDLIGGMSTEMTEVNNYGAEGYLLAINEYLDIMPNFAAFLEEHPDYKAVVTAPDGNIYGLVNYNTNTIARLPRTFINKVWLENLGLEKPTNADELYEVLKAFKEQDANGNGDPDDEVPLTGGFGSLNPFLHMFGIFSNNMTYSPVVDENGTVVLGQATDNYKEMLKYFKRLYEEGLYDADGLVQTEDEMRAKVAEDRIGMVTTGGAPFVLAGADTTYDLNWTALMGLTSDVNDVRAAVFSSGTATTVRVAVNAETEYPEAICRLIDFLYTEEGSIAGNRGFLGVSTEETELEGAEGLFTIGIRSDWQEDYPEYASDEEYRYKKAVINEAFKLVSMFKGTNFELCTKMSEEEMMALPDPGTWQGWMSQVELESRKCTAVDVFPALAYFAEEGDARATLMTDIKMYIEQAFGQFITGELDVDADWDTYISTLEKMGMNDLIEIEQTAYDRAYK